MTELANGDLIRHPELGIGQVMDVDAEGITVRFRRGGERRVRAEELARVSPEGFWREAYSDPEAAARRISQHPVDAVAMLLRDFPNNEAQTAEIRQDVGEFVTDWSAWWQRTQPLLKRDPSIDTSRSRQKIYALAQKPRSLTEELYDEFRDLPSEVAAARRADHTSINPDKLTVAREILVAVADGEELSPAARSDVQNFAVRAMASETVTVAERTYMLLRLQDLGWLADDEVRSTLAALCNQGIRLYELSPFAQNRVIDAILKYVGAEDGRASLLTAFSTRRKLIREVCDIYLARGQGATLLEGLWVGLTDDLAETSMEKEELRRWYAALARRLRGLSEALDRMVFDADVQVDWGRLADHLAVLLVHLSKLDVKETLPQDLLRSLVGLWCRSMAYTPDDKEPAYLDVPLAGPLRAHIAAPFLAAIFKRDPSLQLADSFVQRMSRKDDLQLDDLLESIVTEHWAWGSEVEALTYVTGGLQARPDAIDWVTQRTIATVHEKSGLLPKYLPVLDRLSQFRTGGEWGEKVNGLRQRAFRDLCEAITKGESLDLPLVAFDDASRGGLKQYLAELESEFAGRLEEARVEIEEARNETRLAEDRLARSEASLGELRKSYRQPDRELRFAERLRILGDLASVTAEIERFSQRPASDSKHLLGVVRRLNGLLATFRAEPFGEVGAEVTFDPSHHEFVGETDVLVETVTVLERGYTIRDLDGEKHVLRPARVTTQGGGG